MARMHRCQIPSLTLDLARCAPYPAGIFLGIEHSRSPVVIVRAELVHPLLFLSPYSLVFHVVLFPF